MTTITKMIDLHLHLDGAISTESARELAEMQNIEIPEDDEALLKLMRADGSCKGLPDFLSKFAFPVSLLQTPEGVSTAVYNLCEELLAQDVIYAEIRFAPQLLCQKGMSQEEVVRAAIAGLRRSEMRAGLILCCYRGEQTPENIARNQETLRLAHRYLGRGVCGADLAGDESAYPTHGFEALFEYACEHNVPFEIHAGEAAGAQSVREAIDMGASRIGHGVHSTEDPELVRELAESEIPLLICPTSNLQTHTVPALSELPVRRFLDAGVPFTISTDDPSIEGTTLKAEWHKVIRTFRLTQHEVRKLMLNAVYAAFCDEHLREELRQEIEEAYNEDL